MEPFDDMQPTPALPCYMPPEPEALAAQERMRVTAAVRSRTNKVTALSFLYIAILTACVSAAGVVSMLLTILLDPTILRLSSEALTSRLMEAFTQATFGYLLAVPAIFEALHKAIWKGIRAKGKEKTVRKAMKICNAAKKLNIDLTNLFFKEIKQTLGGRMRMMICGGAAINPEILEDLQSFGIMALQGYGLS